MFGFDTLHLELLSSARLWIALAATGLIALTIWVYRRTNPPVPASFATLLGVLRGIAIVALVGALLEPVLGFVRTTERLPRLTLLLDASSSMDQVEAGKSRAARLDSLLASPSLRNLEQGALVTRWLMADKIAEQSTGLDREQTALGEAIRQAIIADPEAPPDQIILFSDGNSNSGRRPIDLLSPEIPVHTVDLALTSGTRDLAIESFDVNPVLFVGQPSEVGVTISWNGVTGQQVKLELLQGDRLLATAPYTITQEGGRADLRLAFTPNSPGQLLLRLSIPPVADELSTANNVRTFSVRVLKSRLSVLIHAERLDLDLSALQRALRRSGKYELTISLTGTGQLARPFPSSQAELNRYDLVVLHDPNPDRLAPAATLIREYLAARGGAIWLQMGEQFASAGPSQWLAPLLPFTPGSRRPIRPVELHADPVEEQLFHPVTRLSDDRSTIRQLWQEQPPFRALVMCDRMTARSTILATVTMPGDSTRWPVLGFRQEGAGKLFASAVAPWWHWKFVQSGLGQDGERYDRLVESIASWLTIAEDANPVRIAPVKEIFTRGEPVQFTAVATDAGLRAIEGATGRITLRASDSTPPIDVDLVDRLRGNYAAEFRALLSGTYAWTGRLEKDGALLREVKGTIHVEPFSVEEAVQGGDPAMMNMIASASGGRAVTVRHVDELITSIPTARIEEETSGEFRLWGTSWLLYLCLGALALEWVLRKSRQLL